MSLDNELVDFDDTAPDTFGFSFVDMVSGGFGAAFFLFLIFATLPLDVGAPGGGGERFIQVWLTWQGGDKADVTFEPIMEFAPPNSENWRSYRMTEGKLRQTGQFGDMRYGTGAKAFWANVFGAGFSDAKETAFRRVDVAPDSERSGLWLHFSDPCPGRYRIRVNRNAGFRDLLLSSKAAEGDYPFTLTLEAPGHPRKEIEVSAAPSGDELAPYFVLDLTATDQERNIFEILEPATSGPDLDHCK